MLTTDEISQMRGEAEATLTETGAVYRKTEQGDGAGGMTVTESLVGNFKTKISQGFGRVTLLANRINLEYDAVLRFPHNADIQEGDRVQVGTRSFRIQSIQRPTILISLMALSLEEK